MDKQTLGSLEVGSSFIFGNYVFSVIRLANKEGLVWCKIAGFDQTLYITEPSLVTPI